MALAYVRLFVGDFGSPNRLTEITALRDEQRKRPWSKPSLTDCVSGFPVRFQQCFFSSSHQHAQADSGPRTNSVPQMLLRKRTFAAALGVERHDVVRKGFALDRGQVRSGPAGIMGMSIS